MELYSKASNQNSKKIARVDEMKFVENQPSDDTIDLACRMCPLEKNSWIEKAMKSQIDEKYFKEQIQAIKEALGEELIILTYHYQHK